MSGLSRSCSGRRPSSCQEPLTRALRRTLHNQLQNLSGRSPAPGTQPIQKSGSASAWDSRGPHLSKTSGTFWLPASSAPPGRGGPEERVGRKAEVQRIRRREHRALFEFLGFRRWVLYRVASVRRGPWYLIPPLMERSPQTLSLSGQA